MYKDKSHCISFLSLSKPGSGTVKELVAALFSVEFSNRGEQLSGRMSFCSVAKPRAEGAGEAANGSWKHSRQGRNWRRTEEEEEVDEEKIE